MLKNVDENIAKPPSDSIREWMDWKGPELVSDARVLKNNVDWTDPVNYANMEVFAVIAVDHHGRPMSNFSGITKVLGSNCVAIMHDANRITLMTPSAKIWATFDVCSHKSQLHKYRSNVWGRYLAANPANDDLLFVDCACRIRIINVPKAWCSKQFFAETIVEPSQPEEFRGLAFVDDDSLFTSTRSNLLSFTLNGSLKSTTPIAKTHDDDMPTVLGAFTLNLVNRSDDRSNSEKLPWLFYTNNDGAVLNAVPIDCTTSSPMPQAAFSTTDCLRVTGIAFDKDGNMLAADTDASLIKVFNSHLEPVCVFSPKNAIGFAPAGIATMISGNGSRIVVTPDLTSRRVFFFKNREEN